MNINPELASLKYLVLETTRRCNLRCIHCMVSEENNLGNYEARDLPMDVFLKLLPMIREFKPTVQLSGHGETFLHPNFMEMVEGVVGVGCNATFQTNGTILTQRNVEKFVGLGVEAIVISIDGASPEVFDKIRRRASLEKIVANIRLINETKKRLKTNRPHLGIEFAAMRQNIHELPSVVKMAGELGVENFQVAELAEYNMTQGQSLVNDPLMAEWAPKAEVEARRYGINLMLPPNIPGRQVVSVDTMGGVANPVTGNDSISAATPATYKGLRKTCKEPWEKMFVQYDGSVRPCCVIGESYGNLSTQTFQEVWHGPRYQSLRESLLSDEPYAVCVKCPFYGWERQETPEPATDPAQEQEASGAPPAMATEPAIGPEPPRVPTAAGPFRRKWMRLLRKLSGTSTGDLRR
ncbi:MAG TPA: radical SAM protein [Terriglobia bacterium]|nr:radical SAM protein [Terriglobia bacterium]